VVHPVEWGGGGFRGFRAPEKISVLSIRGGEQNDRLAGGVSPKKKKKRVLKRGEALGQRRIHDLRKYFSRRKDLMRGAGKTQTRLKGGEKEPSVMGELEIKLSRQKRGYVGKT